MEYVPPTIHNFLQIASLCITELWGGARNFLTKGADSCNGGLKYA